MISSLHEHHTWIEISKNAINHNIAQYKKIIGNKIIAPVIKGNAYGHDIVEIGHICEKNKNVEWICVSSLDEALILRKNKITKPILVLSYIGNIESVKQAVFQNISVVAHNIDTIKKLDTVGKNLGKQFDVHIKIDTGLSRLGINTEHATAFIKQVKNFNHINIEGIWTHFAQTQSANTSFTNQQANRFVNLIKKLKNTGITAPFVHTSNSAASLTVNLECNNFFRPGIGIYGYWASDYIKDITKKLHPNFFLQHTLTWKSKIFSIKHIPANSFVGYDKTYQVKSNAKIAIVPVGYYDGYDRRFSNKGQVLVNNQLAPIVGLVCMNVLMINITKIKNVKTEDEVTLIGNTNGIKVNDLAKIAKLNPREITTKINSEIPRIIVD